MVDTGPTGAAMAPASSNEAAEAMNRCFFMAISDGNDHPLR